MEYSPSTNNLIAVNKDHEPLSKMDEDINNDSNDLLAQTAELEAMGISVMDQQSLERNVEAAVDNAMVKHTRKQKLNSLKRELKHTQMKAKHAVIKHKGLQSRVAGMKTRFVDPRKLMKVEKDIKDKQREIDELNMKEMVLMDRINIGTNNEAELDDFDDLELEDGEIFDDEPSIDANKQNERSQDGSNTAIDKSKTTGKHLFTKEAREKLSVQDNLISSGEMTPFGTVMKDRLVLPKPVCSSGASTMEQYLKDQLNKQKHISQKRKLTNTTNEKESLTTGSAFPFKKLPKTIREFKGLKRNETVRKSNSPVKKDPTKKKILHPKKKKYCNVGSVISVDESDSRKTPRRPLSETVALESPVNSDYYDSDSEYVPSDHSDSNLEDQVESKFTKELKKVKRKSQDEENFNDPVKKKKARQRDDGNYDDYETRIKAWMKEKTRAKHQKIVNEEDLDSEDDEDRYEDFDGGYKIPLSIWKKLFKYQKTGVRWLWELHSQSSGGILGDEMGLGKTIQIISFLIGLSYSGLYSSGSLWRGLGPVLIVTPATVLHQWVREFHKWWPPFRVAVLHDSGSYDGTPHSLVSNINKNCGMLIISYTGLRSHLKTLLRFSWHYLILDEGHKIRNPEAQITVAVKRFQTPHRLILSGSPIQNNLKELWSLFDFIFPGKLGTLSVFMTQFAVPITQGGYSNANKLEVQTAFKCACILRDTINPYLLRRMKNDVRDHLSLPDKNEQVLFCGLSDEQRTAYKEYLESREVQTILGGRLKVFVGLINLRKICNHPDLYTGGPRHHDEESQLQPEMNYGWSGRSGKMRVLHSILKLWSKQGHKVLLFSQSKQMLCILEKFLLDEGHTYLKMDGGTAVCSRQPLIEKYNSDPSIFVFLLTTRVGGLGVNLTGADRIIIYDPDWNPSTDTQARERAWRIGQLRHVTIYRLLTAGTIEEKIYHRQIFKQFITNRVLKDPKQQRFFKSNSLFELFTLNEGMKEKTESSSLFAGLGSEISKSSIKNEHDDYNEESKCQTNSKTKIYTETYQDIIKNNKSEIKLNVEIKNSVDTLSTNINFDSELNTPVVPEDKKLNIICSNNDANNLHIASDTSIISTTKVDAAEPESQLTISEASEGDAKRERMLKLAKMLSKKLISNEISNKSSLTKERSKGEESKSMKRKHSKEKDAKSKHKGKKFEGERIEYLVKKRNFKYSEDDDKKEEKVKNQSQDQYVLDKLFKSSGIHTAMNHDAIINAGDSDYLLLETEAEKVAKEAIRNVRASRALCFNPNLPKIVDKPKFGTKKKFNGFLQEKSDTKVKPTSSEKVFMASHIDEDDSDSDDSSVNNNGLKFGKKINNKSGSASGMISSTELIARMKARNTNTTIAENDSEDENPDNPPIMSRAKQIDPDFQDNMDLLADIRNFIAFQAEIDGRASTIEIISRFKDRLPPDKSHIFKALLKEICDFCRERDRLGYWYIKTEFR